MYYIRGRSKKTLVTGVTDVHGDTRSDVLKHRHCHRHIQYFRSRNRYENKNRKRVTFQNRLPYRQLQPRLCRESVDVVVTLGAMITNLVDTPVQGPESLWRHRWPWTPSPSEKFQVHLRQEGGSVLDNETPCGVIESGSPNPTPTPDRDHSSLIVTVQSPLFYPRSHRIRGFSSWVDVKPWGLVVPCHWDLTSPTP